MKKTFKIISKLVLLSLFIVFSMIAYIVYQLETSIDDVLSKEQQEWLFTSIDDTEDLPEYFYVTIEKYFPNYFTTSFWDAAFSSYNQSNRVFCQCHSIYQPYIQGEPFPRRLHFPKVVLSLELEERYSHKKCFTYIMNTSKLGGNTYGVKEAVKLFYQKELKDLTEREIIELLMIQKAPYHYNPFRNRERLDKEVNRILNSLKK